MLAILNSVGSRVLKKPDLQEWGRLSTPLYGVPPGEDQRRITLNGGCLVQTNPVTTIRQTSWSNPDGLINRSSVGLRHV